MQNEHQMADPDHVKWLERDIKKWNVRREQNPCIKPNLRHADFSFKNLSSANLSNANLGDANLSGANLSNANLSNANLSAAILNNASLGNANLTNADLRNADLSNADLSGADSTDANLSNADLNKSDLSGTNFNGANLVCANFADASLRDADFSHTDLLNANFFHADLTRANFCRADLTLVDLKGARLCVADLRGAKFVNADLSHANLEGSSLLNTIFSNVDFTNAKGLKTCIHHGTSAVDHLTLEKNGSLPEVFLKGVGFSDVAIQYMPAIYWENPIEFFSCFISYSHADKAFAQRLHDTLQGRGIRCWLDEHEVLPGDDIYEAVDRGIKIWDKTLLCCSKDSLTSWWVDNEIATTFQKEQRIMKERKEKVLALIPLDLDGFLFSDWTSAKKAQVTERLAADFQGWKSDHDKFEQQIEKVVKALRTGDGGRREPPEPKL
jgi:uncharacterized protein YjbI with pentapeptide repeats